MSKYAITIMKYDISRSVSYVNQWVMLFPYYTSK